MSDRNVVWVTGSSGFLGSVVCERMERAGFTVLGTNSEVSVCDPERLEAFAEEVQPGVVINCAGIRRDVTSLSDRIKAYEVNALGARNVALAANTIGATIVQISSDDVYASKLEEPVNEFDEPQPDTPYGKTKRAGELMVRNTTPDHIIVRSSWIYHAYSGRMKDILDAAAAGEKYVARMDQYAAPTSVASYVEFLVKAIERNAKGTFHITPRGRASRYEFAAKILEYAGYDPSTVLMPETEPKTAENVVLESLMLEMVGAKIPTWEEDLHAYMEAEGLLKG